MAGDGLQECFPTGHERGIWLALRDAHVMALTALDMHLRDSRLPATERDLWLRIRQARLIELGAVEEFLELPRTMMPRRKRKAGETARAASWFLHEAQK